MGSEMCIRDRLTLWMWLALLGAVVGLLAGWLASGRYLRELE